MPRPFSTSQHCTDTHEWPANRQVGKKAPGTHEFLEKRDPSIGCIYFGVCYG